MRGLGHRVTVLSPLYASVDPEARAFSRRLTKVEVELGGRTYACELYDGRTAGGVNLLFIGNEELFRNTDHLDGPTESRDQVALRAGLLAGAATQIARHWDVPFEVVHAFDWPGALFAIRHHESQPSPAIPCVLTLHDPGAQGSFDAAMASLLGLDVTQTTAPYLHGGAINVMRGGILTADQITLASASYARQVKTTPHGHGLEDAFDSRGEHVVGILHGVDSSLWNPSTDAALPARFDPLDLAGKTQCKAQMQRGLELPIRSDVPLIGAVSHGDPRGGFDLLMKVLGDVLRNDCQLAVLHDGDEGLRRVLVEHAERYPDRLQVRTYGDGHAHRLFAASDMFLLPAREAPSAMTAMCAHRYGSLPIARETGCLGDAVIDADAELKTGSGFLFTDATTDDLLAVVRRAIAAFGNREAWNRMRRRVMRVDHSWERSARLHERLYKGLGQTSATT